MKRHRGRMKTPTCPYCGGQDIATIVYGYVALDDGLDRDLAAGKIALGGCCITGHDPAWKCNSCTAKFGVMQELSSPDGKDT